MKQSAWLLHLGNAKTLRLRPHDLDYFQTHFVGEAMATKWRPPPVTIQGKSKRLTDFVSWMHQAPVCSERAKDSLEPVIGDSVEFLRLVEIRGKPYYAINVLKLVDCLDWTGSRVTFSPSAPDRILDI